MAMKKLPRVSCSGLAADTSRLVPLHPDCLIGVLATGLWLSSVVVRDSDACLDRSGKTSDYPPFNPVSAIAGWKTVRSFGIVDLKFEMGAALPADRVHSRVHQKSIM